MVTRDRGQLILVGAIAIALILLGLVLIINTALFTQVVGSEGTVESAKEGGVSGQEIGNGIGAIVAEENLEEDTVSDVENDVRPGVTNHLQPALANRSVDGSGAFVSANYIGVTEQGQVLQQSSSDLVGNWVPVLDSEVGYFLMTVDTTANDGDEFYVTADSNSGPKREVTVSVNSAGDQVTLEDGSGATICSGVPATDGTVRIDFRHGAVYESGDCQFDLFPDSEGQYDVGIVDSDNDFEATYTIVTNDPRASFTSIPGTVDVNEAVWAFEYEFTHDSTDATVTSERREVEVYD